MVTMRMFWTSSLGLLYIFTSLLSFNAVALGIPFDPDIKALNGSSFPNVPTNLTDLGAIDPKKFSFVIKPGGKLSPTASLMNAVNAMVQLALMDYNGKMPETTFTLDDPKYSQVEVIVSPISTAPGATLPPGIAVLGLFKLMNYILSDPLKRFNSYHCYLSYQNREVATLEIRKPPTALLSSPSNESDETESGTLITSRATHLVDSTADLSAPPGTPLEAPAWRDPHLNVTIVQGLTTLTIYEFFSANLALLQQLAPNPSAALVVPRTVTIDAPPITVAGKPIVVSWKSTGRPPRTVVNPPSFRYGWLIKAFGQLPQYMLENGFKDVVFMGLKVDEVKVGEAYFVRKESGQPSLDATS